MSVADPGAPHPMSGAASDGVLGEMRRGVLLGQLGVRTLEEVVDDLAGHVVRLG